MKIFISYSHKDRKLAKAIRDILLERGYSPFWAENISIGDSISHALDKEMLEADILLAIISDNYLESTSATSEWAKALGYSRIRSKPKVLPYVICNPTNLQNDMKNIAYLRGSENREDDISKILSFLDKMKISDEIQTETEENAKTQKRIRSSFDSYIDGVFSKLEKKESQNKILAYICYGISVVFLILAVIVAFIFFNISTSYNVSAVIQSSLRAFAVISLILALSRMSFVLGKSFMAESIRNSDRIHAISFGEFFIKAYGDKASRDEIRDVFREWNIGRGSPFVEQEPNESNSQIAQSLQILTDAIKNDKS